MRLNHLAFPLVLALAPATWAQEVVGTSVLGGKKVHLYDNGTWAYADAAPNGKCVSVHQTVDFCGSILNWRPTKSVGDFNRIFTHSRRINAGLIIEEYGRNEGNNFEYMRGMALDAAAESSGVQIEEIPVLSIMDTDVDGLSGETIIYGAQIDGLRFVFANTFIVEDNLTIQAMVWAVGSEFSDDHQKWHADFIENLRVNIQEQTQ
jgi:hypothetical protein